MTTKTSSSSHLQSESLTHLETENYSSSNLQSESLTTHLTTKTSSESLATHMATMTRPKPQLTKTLSTDSAKQIFARHDVKRTVIRGSSVKSPTTAERSLTSGDRTASLSPGSCLDDGAMMHDISPKLSGHGLLHYDSATSMTSDKRSVSSYEYNNNKEKETRMQQENREATAAMEKREREKRVTIEWDAQRCDMRHTTHASSVKELKSFQSSHGRNIMKRQASSMKERGQKSATLPKSKEHHHHELKTPTFIHKLIRKQSEYVEGECACADSMHRVYRLHRL